MNPALLLLALFLFVAAGPTTAATTEAHSFSLLFNSNRQGQYLPCG